MINICMRLHEYRSYTETSECIVAGQGFHSDKLYKGSEFHSLVSSWDTKEEFVDGIQKLNGFYAIISKKGSQLFVAVDRVRSIPLFYGHKANDFYLSDSADWVREQVGNTEIDSLAKDEFLLTGYVTGPDTLYPDVKQLQAGEALIVDEINGQIKMRPYRYYRFIHEYEQKGNLDELMAQHDEILVRIFNRLIQVANGRTMVVPLSGGLDSRLIVLMLKRLGYENIITFTYGRPGNIEAEVSRKVAELLGLRWEFIPYSNEDWYRWFNSKERKGYWQFASGLASLPHIQDWPAVMQLKNENMIPDDSLFIPGHTPMLSLNGKPNLGQLNTDAIFKKHYFLTTIEQKHMEPMQQRINYLIINQLGCPTNGMLGFYLWECTERQSKFIANSVRVYEFWGFDWYLPFWDKEYFDFCLGLNEKHMFRKALFKLAVDSLLYSMTGYIIPRDDLKPNCKRRVLSALRPYLNDAIKYNLKRIIKANKLSMEHEYQSHPLAWYGILSEDYFKSHYTGKENINSFLTRLYFEET